MYSNPIHLQTAIDNMQQRIRQYVVVFTHMWTHKQFVRGTNNAVVIGY